MVELKNMLAMSGVQQMFGNLLKSVAPEIAAQVEQIANVAIDLKAQVDRMEAQQLEIMRHLGISVVAQTAAGELNGGKDLRGSIDGTVGASHGIGNETG